MKSPFLVDKNKVYEKEFDCIIRNGSITKVMDSDEKYELSDDEERFTIKFKFRPLTHAQNTNIFSRTFDVVGEDMRINVAEFNDLRLRSVLQNWNLVDEEGNKLDISNETLNNLHPAIAQRMINMINSELGIEVARLS